MRDYIAGEVAKITLPFTDDTKTPIDPDTVALAWAPAGGTVTTITYANATQPGIGIIARIALGVYVAWIDTTGLAPGVLTYVPYSTGVGQTISEGQLNILPRPLP